MDTPKNRNSAKHIIKSEVNTVLSPIVSGLASPFKNDLSTSRAEK